MHLCICASVHLSQPIPPYPLSYARLLRNLRSLARLPNPLAHPRFQLQVVKGNITFDKVRFSYDNFKTTVLSDLSFEVLRCAQTETCLQMGPFGISCPYPGLKARRGWTC